MRNQQHIRFYVRFGLIAGILFFTRSVKAQDVDYKAYSLFVYNFMKYVEWPEAESKGDFIIAVLGDTKILPELNAMAAAKKLKGRTIVVKKVTTVEECKDADLVYIAASKSAMAKTFREQYKDKSMLIVGEREGLAKKGACLSFATLDDDQLKFDISKKELAARKLTISEQLVKLGIVVD
jgi:hypothetical protein